MEKLKSKYEILVERLRGEGKVEVIGSEIKNKIIEKVESGLDSYRFENQKRIKESQEEISTVVLTA